MRDRIDSQKLFTLLTKYEILFDGTLGTFNTEPVDIDFKLGKEPTKCKAFPVPVSRLIPF